MTDSLPVWTNETVFNSGDEAIDNSIELIRNAKSTVELEVYIFHNDICGDRFADELAAAAQRGVRVRLLVDGIGSAGFSRTYQERLLKAGVAVRIYHPTPYDYYGGRLFWWSRWKQHWRILGRINKRNHRKTLVVDSEKAIVGSVNITKCHLSKKTGGLGWRDSAVLVEGSAVTTFLQAFKRSWEFANKIAFTPPPDIPMVPVLFNMSAKLRRLKYLLLIELIYRAENRVWITNAYFIPYGSLLKALRFAAWTGVDVKIIVPQRSDVFFIRMVSSAFYLGLLTAGVRIFEYAPAVLHAKTLLIDSIGVVGTSNLNHRSLLHDQEVDVILKKPDSIKSLANAFENDLKNCKEVTIKEWEARPTLEKFFGNMLLLMRYWL